MFRSDVVLGTRAAAREPEVTIIRALALLALFPLGIRFGGAALDRPLVWVAALLDPRRSGVTAAPAGSLGATGVAGDPVPAVHRGRGVSGLVFSY